METKKDTSKKEEGKLTVEQLLKENEFLKQQLSAFPTDLESRLAFVEKQRKNARKLSLIDSSIKAAEDVKQVMWERLDELQQSELAFILINAKDTRYVDNAKMKITDPQVLTDITDYIIDRLRKRREEITNEICA